METLGFEPRTLHKNIFLCSTIIQVYLQQLSKQSVGLLNRTLFWAWVQIPQTSFSFLLFLIQKGSNFGGDRSNSPPQISLYLRALNSSQYQTNTIEFITLELLSGIFFINLHKPAIFVIFISKLYPKLSRNIKFWTFNDL